MSNGPSYTDKELFIIKQLASVGYGLDDISNVLVSRSRESIRRKVKELGILIIYKPTEINEDMFKKLMKIKGK